MSLDHINSKKIRKSFGKIPLVTSLPNLVEVQKRSFDNFLQLRTDPDKRESVGLQSIFKSVSSQITPHSLSLLYKLSTLYPTTVLSVKVQKPCK